MPLKVAFIIVLPQLVAAANFVVIKKKSTGFC